MKRRGSSSRGFRGIVNGTTYHDDTDPRVVEILERVRQSGGRVCLRYGDRKTGRDWGDMRMCGKISRSMGPQKIPILVKTSRSMGGEGLLEQDIVQITEPGSKRKLYEVPNYHLPSSTERYAADVNAQWRLLHPDKNFGRLRRSRKQRTLRGCGCGR